MIYKVTIAGGRAPGENDPSWIYPETLKGVFETFGEATRWAYETLHVMSNELGGIRRNLCVEITTDDTLRRWALNEEAK